MNHVYKETCTNACRYWLQGKFRPSMDRLDFLSLLMTEYKLKAQEAYDCMSDAEWAEQFKDQPEIANFIPPLSN